MFITKEDYRTVIGEAALRTVCQTSADIRSQAEEEAMEEISGYLRPTYDTARIFAAEADGRNRLVVMYTCDIALYHMISAMPQKMGSEVRKERYERAIRWLEGVQAGKIIPDLPMAAADGENPSGGTLIYHSQPPLRHNW